MNGNQEVTSVTIDPELLADKGKLEDAVKEAYNDTVKKPSAPWPTRCASPAI